MTRDKSFRDAVHATDTDTVGIELNTSENGFGLVLRPALGRLRKQQESSRCKCCHWNQT